MESCADNTNTFQEEMQNGFPEVPTTKKRCRKQDEPVKWKSPDQQGMEEFLDTVTLQQEGCEAGKRIPLNVLTDEVKELLEEYEKLTEPKPKKRKRVTLTQVNEKIDKVLEILHSWNTPVAQTLL